MITQKRMFGNQGENAVTQWLTEHHFSILARNYHTRTGEVDIIAAKNDVVSFVEVKTRKSPQFSILNTITYTKQKRIARAAISYVLSNNIKDKVLRFDVATVTTPAPGTYTISYIENAFSAPH
jgi:putative endonuclease